MLRESGPAPVQTPGRSRVLRFPNYEVSDLSAAGGGAGGAA